MGFAEENIDPCVSGIAPTPTTIQNIVATVDLDCKLDTRQIASHAPNAEYAAKRRAVTMRIQDPKCTALIYSSGKMVCIGAKSEQDSECAARRFTQVLLKLGFDVKLKSFKIDNMVASCDVNFPIRLDCLASSHTHGPFSSYEPELFPAVTYRMKEPKVTIRIFSSGKIVITGAKVRHDVYKAFDLIYPVLAQFRRPIPPILDSHP